MLDQLAGLGGLDAFLLIAGLVAGDSVVPAFPGEAASLAGAVLAARGDLSLLIVFAATWAGAVVGDNVTFGVGRGAGERVLRGRSDRLKERVAWIRRRLDARGPVIILVARFIPGGRNAIGLAAGATGMGWRTYAAWDALAAVLWALFATGLGYASGRTFEGSVLLPLALSLVVAALVGAGGELAMRRADRRALSRGA